MSAPIATPYVVRRSSHTAIVVLHLSETISHIAMDDEQLRIKTCGSAAFFEDGWAPYEYDAVKAAAVYLQHKAGMSADARRALLAVSTHAPKGSNTITKDIDAMTIETNLTRIADALEKLLEINTGRNLALEALLLKSGDAPAEEVKAAPKKTRGKKEEPAPEPEVTPEPEVVAEVVAEPEPVVKDVPISDIQVKAAKLAKQDRDGVLALIKHGNHAKISDYTDAAERAALWARLETFEQSLEVAEEL